MAHGHGHVQTARPEHSKPKGKATNEQGVQVRGVDNMLIRFAKCCNPVPGDQIIGYITRGSGVTIHRADCPNFEKSDGSKLAAGRMDQGRDRRLPDRDSGHRAGPQGPSD